MKMRLVGILAIVGVSFFSAISVSETQSPLTGKLFPEVTFDKVQEIFGHNLDTENTQLKTLLLAIGMDHTSTDSPHFNERIGIPYIVHHGPGYWVGRLKSGDRSLEVLVNNALLLLFTKEAIPKGKDTAYALLRSAADKGYWPADFFVAETNLSEYLSVDSSDGASSTKPMDEKTRRIAQETMLRYNRCSAMGYAPCQYRIGFWLSSSPKTLKDGLDILRAAIQTTRNDLRYQGVLDGALIKAANEIVFKGDLVGMDTASRKEYANLVQQQISKLTKDYQYLKQK